MTHRNLFVLATLALLLGGPTAFAERLGGSYRGPEDMTKSEKEATGSTDAGTQGGTGGGASSSGDSGGGGGGTGADSGGGGGSGGGSEGGSGGEGGGSPSSPSGDSGGPDAGGSGDTSGGKSGGSTGSSGGDSTGAAGGSGSTGGGRGKAAASQDQFYIVSWFFENNREQFFAHHSQSQGQRFQIPTRSSATQFGVLPRDTRRRSEITAEDKDKIFDILKKQVQLAPEAIVRDAAVVALGKLGTPAAADLLKRHIGQEHDLQVKQDALVALGMTRSPLAVDVLVDTVKGDKSGKLVSFALLGLGLSQDAGRAKAGDAALAYFTANVKRSNAEDAVCCAASALGALRHAEAVKPLAQALLSSKGVSDLVRCFAAQALGKIGGDAAQKALEDALQHGGQEVERAAAAALGGFDSPAVARMLAGKEGVGKADPLGAGLAAISLGRVLGQIDEDEWKGFPDALREAAMNPGKSGVKSQYSNVALSLFGGFDKKTQDYYARELAEPKLDKDVQSAMAMAAGLGGFSAIQTTLLNIAKDAGRNVATRSYAALALGMVGESHAKDTAKSLQDLYKTGGDDPNVRRGAILGLGFVGDRADVPFLLSVIEQTKEDLAGARYTRGAAVIALGMIRDGESVARIQELMGRSDAKTRAFALAALGCLADKDEVPVTSQLFDSANFRVRTPSIDAIKHQL